MRVLNLQPSWFIRPHNTDWRHSMTVTRMVNDRLKHTGLSMANRSDLSSIVTESLGHLARSLRGRYRRTRFNPSDYLVDLPADQLARFDVVYAYGRYLRKKSSRPVVWHDGPSDSDLLRKHGWSDQELDTIRTIKLEAMSDCASCLVSSTHAASLFSLQYPDQAEKIIVAPFLLPHVQATTAAEVIEKHSRRPLRILFVGREAQRKGLDILLDAYSMLQDAKVEELRLDVVSSFQDGWRPSGTLAGVHLHGGLPAAETMALMREAHVLVMPSRVESYGIVYVEAMSQGTLPVAVDREPQRSLLGAGRYGMLTSLDATELAVILGDILKDGPKRSAMAEAALNHFEANFSLGAVLKQYERAFTKAAEKH